MSRRPQTTRRAGAIAAAELQHKPATGEPLQFQMDPWTRRLIRPLLIAALATSVSIAILVLVRNVAPHSRWLAFAPLCFFIALEGAYTTAWLNNPDSNGVDHWGYRLAEILLILALTGIYRWALSGAWLPSPEQLHEYLTAPLSVFSNSEFLTAAFVALIAWAIAAPTSRIFTRLDLSIYEINFYRLSPAEQSAMGNDRPAQVKREALLDAYQGNWLIIGMVMVTMAALSTFEVAEFATVSNPFDITRLGLSTAMLFALITYFLAGFWLLSHGRLLRMNARWLVDGIAKDADLDRRWQQSTLRILAAIALIAAFIPIGSSLPISRILSLGVAGAATLLGAIVEGIGFLFAKTVMVVAGNTEETEIVPPLQATPPAINESANLPLVQPNSSVEMMMSYLFWTVAIALILGAFFYFIRERGYNFQRDEIVRQWDFITGWLREWWANLTKRTQTALHELEAHLRAPERAHGPRQESTPSRRRFLRRGNLSVRDQIRFYYLALERRADERGIQRSRGQTPLEYALDLKNSWPEADQEIEALTDAFNTAQYSSHPINKSALAGVKRQWLSLKRHLRRPG